MKFQAVASVPIIAIAKIGTYNVSMAKYPTYKKGELALKILFLISAGALIPAILVAPNLAQVAVPLLKELVKKLESKPSKIRRSLAALKRNRLIKVEEKKGETIFTLTENGKRRIVRGDFETLSIPRPNRWDKKWRAVLFDIPEENKDARDALRLKLKELGFYKLQRSCFIYPFECREQVDFITEFFQISEHVNYLVIESLEGERELRQYYEL